MPLIRVQSAHSLNLYSRGGWGQWPLRTDCRPRWDKMLCCSWLSPFGAQKRFVNFSLSFIFRSRIPLLLDTEFPLCSFCRWNNHFGILAFSIGYWAMIIPITSAEWRKSEERNSVWFATKFPLYSERKQNKVNGVIFSTIIRHLIYSFDISDFAERNFVARLTHGEDACVNDLWWFGENIQPEPIWHLISWSLCQRCI